MRGKRKLVLLCLAVFFVCDRALAQRGMVVQLLDKNDTTRKVSAMIRLQETGQVFFSDTTGTCRLTLSPGARSITLDIYSIGTTTTRNYAAPFPDTLRMTLDIADNKLGEVKIKGLTAAEVVRKAIASVPLNYADTGFFAYASYRQYQKMNGNFKNLIEAREAIMFKPGGKKDQLTATEAFAVRALRKTIVFRNPTMAEEEDIGADQYYLLAENPAYHLASGPFALSKLSQYQFSFDTTNTSPEYYIINFQANNYLGETHGIQNYNPSIFLGESSGGGRLIIDRKSFAIESIDRAVFRHPSYSYYGKPNMMLPEREYFIEFINGFLHIEYACVNGRWYLWDLNHQYTNEFYRAASGVKDYTITDVFELSIDSLSRSVGEDLAHKFCYHVADTGFHYDPQQWNTPSAPFYFFSRDSVYNDLQQSAGALDGQYARSAAHRQ